MTVPYNRDVASATSWASIRILFRWRGSIWKSVLPELCMWMVVYYILFFLYYFLGKTGHRLKDKIGKMEGISLLDDDYIISLCRKYANEYSMPLVMLLSFFTTKAFERWQTIFNNLAYAENLALTVTAFIKGSDRIAQLTRHTIMRQAILAQILVYRDVSISVRKRFPTLESLIEADVLKHDELRLLRSRFNPYNVFTIPFCWITTLLTKLRQDGNITGEPTYVNIFTEVKEFRRKLETVYNYDCTPIPLAYPQIVSIAVRFHCIAMIIGNLFMFSKTEGIYLLNSDFAIVQGPELLLYLAWLKVAEILANPLGEDDDDLELNHIIDRNNYLSQSIVETHDQCPVMEESSLTALPKYNEHARGLGGALHRLQGSAVGSKVDSGRMVEVEPTARVDATSRKSDCLKGFGGILGKDVEKSVSTVNMMQNGGEQNINSASKRGSFAVEVPSLYDTRSLRTLSDQELDLFFADRFKRSRANSMSDLSNPVRMSVRRLASETNIFGGTVARL